MNANQTNFLLTLTTLIVLVGLSGCGSKATETTKSTQQASTTTSAPIPVKVQQFQSVTIERTVTGSGQFTTNDESVLSFKIGGVVSQVLVKEGDPIRQGQLLATLDQTEINSQVQQARLGLQKAERDLKRAEALFKDSVVTLEQLQNAKTQLEVLQQQLSAATFNAQYAQIRATGNGYVLRKFVNLGQVVSVGAPVIQTNGANQANWILKVGLSDKDWGLVKVGDKAKIMIDAVPEATFEAVISQKAEQADPATGVLPVEIKITSQQPAKLAAGLFGRAEIYPSQTTQAYALPYQALLDGNGGTGFVFVSRDGGKTATKVEVGVGQLDGNTVQITGGIKPEDLVIVQGSAYLTDGSAISISK
jgi:RND family efflux transporter MFP subunit